MNVILVRSFVTSSWTYSYTLYYLHLPRTPTPVHNLHIIRTSCFTHFAVLSHYCRPLDDDFLPCAARLALLLCNHIIPSYHYTCSLGHHA